MAVRSTRAFHALAGILCLLIQPAVAQESKKTKSEAKPDKNKSPSQDSSGRTTLQFQVQRGADENSLKLTLAPNSPNPYPKEWVVDAPEVRAVCPPTRNAYADASRSVSRWAGGPFRHEVNGGWHRKGSRKVNGKEMLHVGMDVGLYRVGEPVYSMADGVVRISNGPKKPADKKEREKRRIKGDPTKFDLTKETMVWGNLIVIEHKFPDGYFTSVYGHLDKNRLVEAGDTVVAGQMLGRIGRQNPYINGGYIPHLHFAIREGRMGEPNGILRIEPIDGKLYAMRITSITKDKVIVELDRSKPIELPGVTVPQNAQKVPEKIEYPATLMWTMYRWRFDIVGHTTDAKPWLHPLNFLRARGALRNPAPFRRK